MFSLLCVGGLGRGGGGGGGVLGVGIVVPFEVLWVIWYQFLSLNVTETHDQITLENCSRVDWNSLQPDYTVRLHTFRLFCSPLESKAPACSLYFLPLQHKQHREENSKPLSRLWWHCIRKVLFCLRAQPLNNNVRFASLGFWEVMTRTKS